MSTALDNFGSVAGQIQNLADERQRGAGYRRKSGFTPPPIMPTPRGGFSQLD